MLFWKDGGGLEKSFQNSISSSKDITLFSNMVQISDQLAWELVKNNNCFLKKVNGRSKVCDRAFV